MGKLIRLFAIVLLAVFAAGTVAHAANAASMSVTLSRAALADGDMRDCERCPPGDDGEASLCGQVCLAPFVAIPAAVCVELPFVAAEIAASSLEAIVGCTCSPDPSPPRSVIPS